MHHLWILLPLAVLSQEPPAQNIQEICEEQLNRGNFGPDTGYKYYYDKELSHCFPYRYNGAGGGRNSFTSEEDCRALCIAQDQQRCGANKGPTGSCLEWEHFTCQSGSVCRRGAMGVGLCCDEQHEAEWDKEYNPTCSNGLTIATRAVWWGEEPIRGRRCADEFCPNESQCFEGKWLAYCCFDKGSGEEPQFLNDDSPYQ